MPESDTTTQSDSDVFMQEDSAVAAASDNQADDMMMPDQSASGDPAAGDPAAGDPAAGDPAAGDPAAGAQGDDMMAQDDIEAAREAMEQAGSGSEAETGTGTGGTPGSQSGGFPGSAAVTPGIAGGFPGGHGEQSELDKELSESIAIFEGKILDARNEALGSAPPPTSSENVPGVADLRGAGTLEGVEGTFEENDQEGLEAGIPEVIEQARMPEGSDVAKSGEMGSPAIPEDIPDPQGDDIVAKQLRELAIAETDPELKEKLWDEYKKYKAGL